MSTGVIPLVLPVLSTESIIHYTCKYLLETKSIDSLIVLINNNSLVSFTVMARLKAVILGQQPFCAILPRPTTQVEILILAP